MKSRTVGWGMNLFAVAACVIAAGCSRTQEQSDPQDMRDLAVQSVKTLKNGVTAFKMRYPGKRFTELRQLVEGDDPIIDGGKDVLVDPWGNEYKYEVHGKRFAIISFGPDGEEGTEDDIRSDKPQAR